MRKFGEALYETRGELEAGCQIQHGVFHRAQFTIILARLWRRRLLAGCRYSGSDNKDSASGPH